MTSGVGIFAAGTPEVIGVGVDLRISESHSAEADVTTQAIEDGSLVTDHIVLQPDRVEIVAEMSNYDGGGALSVGERAKTAWLAFKNALRSRELFDVVTHHELYEDMALEGITGDHQAPFRGKMTMKLSFVKIDRAQLSVVDVPESQLQADGDNPVAKTASTEVNGGRQDPIDEGVDQSLLAAAADNFTQLSQEGGI